MSIVGLKNLCDPAEFYLTISLIALVIMCFQNFGTNSVYCLGSHSCDVGNNIYIIFFIKLFYILVWTWILNIICRKVSPIVSWVIALFPFVLFFISLFLLFFRTV
jgi:hypothetical protein